jgi:hypothetical protein
VSRLTEALAEVQCPECGTTIRARMADGPAQAAHVAQLERRAQAVRDAWQVAQADDHLLPQGFGWPGDLYDALEAL